MNTEILLGVDYGTSKIGIALGRNGFVMPITEINGKNELSAVHDITRIALENKVTIIVMGLPISGDGKEGFQARKVRRFSKLLKTISKRPLVFTNEYRSTKEAQEEGRDKSLLSGNHYEDSLAAALILKRYYNEKQ
jgi:putative holliday junction resolvase